MEIDVAPAVTEKKHYILGIEKILLIPGEY